LAGMISNLSSVGCTLVLRRGEVAGRWRLVVT
jgi:hypothetical protein